MLIHHPHVHVQQAYRLQDQISWCSSIVNQHQAPFIVYYFLNADTLRMSLNNLHLVCMTGRYGESCDPCLIGMYKSIIGSGSCNECGEGKTKVNVGSISPTDCGKLSFFQSILSMVKISMFILFCTNIKQKKNINFMLAINSPHFRFLSHVSKVKPIPAGTFLFVFGENTYVQHKRCSARHHKI